jgi:hypothetical protein
MEMIKAWHFVGKTLRNGDPIPKDGEWLEYKEPLIICKAGLHASRNVFDALMYAPGATLCLVDCSGQILEEITKLVCSRRRIVSRMDFTKSLYSFARMKALSVAHFWEAPEIVIEYLNSGKESTRKAARIAAGNAIWNNAGKVAAKAAFHAASEEAWSAAGNTAYFAAKAVPLGTPKGAAWFGAEQTAWETSKIEFNKLVNKHFNIGE